MNFREKVTREEALEMFPSVGDAIDAGYDIIVEDKIIIFGGRCQGSLKDKVKKSNLKIYPGKKIGEGSCEECGNR